MQDMMHHCLIPSLLERQRAHLQWQQQQYVSNDNLLGEGWPNLTTTHQYYPNDTREEVTTPSPTTTTTITTTSAQVGKQKSSKKRKADKYSPMVGSDEGEKRMKGDDQGSDRREDSGNISKEKPDYIHVRARRGQATDSHSLAERVRRERISERMKCLQGLVPGCSKITGKAGMLDEIINYVQSLQRQVEFLSMKLAAVNPRLDFNMESLFTKEMNLPSKPHISTVGMSPPEVEDLTILQLHSLQQAVASWGFDMDMDMAINPPEVAVRTPISTPATSPETLLDSSINVQRTNAGWDNDYGSAFPFHSLQGNILSNLKYEM